jgi:CMP-N,N'-diacetyllegionaminic acid synthase
MIGDKRLLGIIPARGGSKRLPRKNVIELGGKPLIAWTLESALCSKYIDRIFVSTDNSEIAEIAKNYGVEVPFMRPAELASDHAQTIDTVLHVISELEKQKETYDYVVLLQPTSPLRTVEDIENSIEMLEESKSDGIISVCEAEHPPLWCNTIPNDGSLSGFLDESILNKRSQDLGKYFRLNGAIYICKTTKLIEEKAFFLQNNCKAFVMSQESSLDIDNQIDLDFAKYRILNL